MTRDLVLLGALVDSADVVHIGRRDDAEPAYGYPALAPAGVLDLHRDEIRRSGIDNIAAQAIDRARSKAAGFWVHFDVDVLDPGLECAERLVALLEQALTAPAS